MNIFERFFGSLLDKIFIMFLFVIIMFVLFQYSCLKYCGTFCGLLNVSPSHYDVIERFRNDPISLLQIDITVVTVFGIVNLIYYYICELRLHASLGKYLLGGICFTDEDNVISNSEAAKRTLYLGLFMFAAVFIRQYIDVTYNFVIVVFFIVMDVPIFFGGDSLLDIITNTEYLSRNVSTNKQNGI